MKRHFERNHPTIVGKNISLFKARLREMKGMQRFPDSTTISTEILLEIFYLINKRIALADEAHTIPKKLIKLCLLEAA